MKSNIERGVIPLFSNVKKTRPYMKTTIYVEEFRIMEEKILEFETKLDEFVVGIKEGTFGVEEIIGLFNELEKVLEDILDDWDMDDYSSLAEYEALRLLNRGLTRATDGLKTMYAAGELLDKIYTLRKLERLGD